MIILRDYDEKNHIDRVWYDSSSILYSECDDKLNELKTLKVVFKGGGTYLYKDVNVQDYVMFIHGGLDGSNGKALNKFIKPKCEFERLENTNLKELNDLLLEYQEKQKPKDIYNKEKEENVETQEKEQDNI